MFVLEGAPDTYIAALTRAQNKEAMLLTVRQMGQLHLGPRRNAINQIGYDEEEEDPASINFVQKGEGKKGVCFFCNKQGHFAKDCYVLKRAEAFLRRTKEAKSSTQGGGQQNPNRRRGRRGGKQKGQKAAVHSVGQKQEEDLPPADENFQKALEDLPDSFFQELTE